MWILGFILVALLAVAWLVSLFLVVVDSIGVGAKILWFLALTLLAPFAIPIYLVTRHRRMQAEPVQGGDVALLVSAPFLVGQLVPVDVDRLRRRTTAHRVRAYVVVDAAVELVGTHDSSLSPLARLGTRTLARRPRHAAIASIQ